MKIMRKRILLLVSVLVLSLLAMASCQFNFGTGGKDTYPSCIVHNADFKGDVRDMAKTLSEQWGNKVMVMQDGFEKESAEIALGNTNRPVTAAAKAILEPKIAAESERTDETDIAGYIIYSDGESIALYWNADYAIDLALEYFRTEYVNAEKLPLKSGFVDCKFFDISAYKEENEAADRNAKLDEAATLLGQAAADALRNHLSIITDDFYIFLANLYSPRDCVCAPDADGIRRCKFPKDEDGNYLCSGGGFYYSPSARDTEGYLPDIESTMQTLSFLESSGMTAEYGSWAAALPEQMKCDLLAFAQSLQDPDDGYFYHPQWGKNVQTSRVSRDLGWATSVISGLGAKPFWNTNNGYEGTYGAPGRGVGPVSYITESFANDTKVSAVSKVIMTAESTNTTWPKQLQTVENFEAYLDDFDLATSSYSAGNTVSSQASQINNRDKQYIQDYIKEMQAQNPGNDFYFTDSNKNGIPDAMDQDNNKIPDAIDTNGDGIADGGFREAFKRHFDDAQNPENGLWESGVYYNSVNGLMKISAGYSTLKLPMNYAEEAFKSAIAMAVLETPDVKNKSASNSVDVYNPWVAMSQIISIVRTYNKDTELSNSLRAIVVENAADMISVTTRKIIKFRKEADGSYGYSWQYSPNKSQGAPASVPNTVEGDVNGGCIATRGTWANMCTVLGISGIPIYYPSDFDKFLEVIGELSPVHKLPIVNTYEPSTFDDDVVGSNESDDIEGFTTTAGGMEIVKDPREKTPGNVLKFFNTPSTAGTTVTFGVNEEQSAEKYVLEWEMCVEENKSNTTILQVKLGSSYMLYFTATSSVVKIFDSSNTTSPKHTNDFGVSFGVGEWHKIRVEYYPQGETSITKIYVDDMLRAVSDNHWNKGDVAKAPTSFSKATFFQLSKTNVTILLDNVSAGKVKGAYEEEEIYNPDYNRDFESVDAENPRLPNGMSATMSGNSSATVVTDPTTSEKNNVLHIISPSGVGGSSDNILINSNASSAKPNVFVADFDLYVNEDSDGELMTLYFCGNNSSNYIVAFKLEAYTVGRKNYVKLVEAWGSGSHEAMEFELGYVGEWIHLTLEYYRYQYTYDEAGELIDSVTTVVSVNDEPVGVSTAYYSINTLSQNYTALKLAPTQSGYVDIYLDNVIIDKITKEYVNEDGETVPDPENPVFPSGGAGTETPAPSTDFDGTYDFESDTAGALPATPGLKTVPNSAEYGNYITIAADPTGAANNVLKHVTMKSSIAGNTQVYTAANNDSPSGDCYVFEFDVYVVKNAEAQIYLSGATTSQNIFSINMKFQTNAIVINNARLDSSNTVNVGKTVNTNGWTTFRIEYYKSVGIAKFFIGAKDVPIYISEVECHWEDNQKMEYGLAKIYTTYGTTAELYFDNVYVATIDKTYVSGAILP